MAAPVTNFFNIGSQSKPPTLLRDEYPQWKIRMISFLEGVRKDLPQYLHNQPFIPTVVVPRVPATATTEEVPEQIKPKKTEEWSPEDWEKHELAAKCKRLIIMAIPNDIFELLDACETSNDLCAELQRELEGGAKQLRNNRTLCINEYFAFKASESESLKYVYYWFNLLVSNLKLLQSLNPECMPLSMSLQTTLDLAN